MARPRLALSLAERELRRRGFLPSTVQAVLRTARDFLAKQRVERLRLAHVRAFLARRQRQGVSAGTQAAELWRLRAFFRALVAAEVLSQDPTSALWCPPVPPPVHRLLGEDQVARLLRAASLVVGCGALAWASALRDRAALELLYGLGLRSIEARAARVVDLDLGQGQLLVRRAKGGPQEWLPLPAAALPHLRAYLTRARPALARGQDQGALLLRDDGRPLQRTGLGKLLARVGRRAGVCAAPHGLRRAVATHLARAGLPLPAVQRFLGHAGLETTQLYVEVDREDLRRAVAALERALAAR